MSTHIDPNIPATLIWLEEGALATTEMFLVSPSDPMHGPDKWPNFDKAFYCAMNLPRSDECLPWIRVGDQIIGPVDLRRMYVPSHDEGL
jgi:hypothetical protein